MRHWVWKYSWTPACDIQFENTPWPPRATFNLKILLHTCVRHSVWKYSWTSACDIQFENTPGPPRQRLTFRFRNFGFGKFGFGKKVSVSVSKKFGLGKKSRSRFRKIWSRKRKKPNNKNSVCNYVPNLGLGPNWSHISPNSARKSQRDSPLYKLFGAGWVQKGVGGIFLKIRPHSCV